MLPFEFVVDGPPVSQQARDRALLQAWKRAVRAEARRCWPPDSLPVSTSVQIVVVYYHRGATVRIDTDNLVKPIQDALNGLVYTDDVLITDTRVRKTNLNGAFDLRGVSPVLAEGFLRGRAFLYVRVEYAPDHREVL